MEPSAELAKAKTIIAEGKFEELIGTREAIDLEYKAELWNLDLNEDKVEFAKDIAAMANTNQGMVVIGISTRTLKTSQDDIVDGFKLLDVADTRLRKLRLIVDEFIYPQLAVSITASPYHRDASLCAVVIEIPASNEESQPFVVLKSPCGKEMKGGSRGLSDKYLSFPSRDASCTTGYFHKDLVDSARFWRRQGTQNSQANETSDPIAEVTNAE